MRLNLLRDMLASGAAALIGAFTRTISLSHHLKDRICVKYLPNPLGLNKSIYYPARINKETGKVSENRADVADCLCVRANVRVHRFMFLGGCAVACEKCHICRHRQPFGSNSRTCGWNQIKSCVFPVFPCGLLHSNQTTRPVCYTLFCLLQLSASLQPKICLIFFFYLHFKMYFGDRWEMHPAAIFFVFGARARTCSLNPFQILHSSSHTAPPTRNKSISSSSSIFLA